MRVSCECGAEYRVRDELAGKRLKCKVCGQTFTVGVDHFDDPDESYEDEPVKRPVRKKKSKKNRSGSSMVSAALPILGKIAWVVGVLNLIGSLPIFLFFVFGFGILGAFIYLLVGPVWVYFGMKGVWGKGIPISSESAIDGNLRIVLGMVLIVVGSISPFVINEVVIQMKAAKGRASVSIAPLILARQVALRVQ